MRITSTTRTLLAIGWLALVYGVYYTKLTAAVLEYMGIADRIAGVLGR